MNCKVKENVINHFIDEGAINELRKVIDIRKFEALNDEMTEKIKLEYNIETNEKIFNLQKQSVKLLRGHSYRRDNIATFFRAIPNEKIFNKIKEINENKDTHEEALYSPMSANVFSGETKKVVPMYNEAILYKENLILRLNNRLNRIKEYKKQFSSDPEKLKELTRQELEIKQRLDGSEELGIMGLRQEVMELKKAPPITRFAFAAEKDLKRLDYLAKSFDPEDMAEAKTIIDFYQKLGTLTTETKDDHPMFKGSEIFDKDSNLILPKETVDLLTDLKKRADHYADIIYEKEKEKTMEIINNDSRVQEMYGRPVNYNEAFYVKEGLKDISWVDMFLMDITNGIFSHNGIVPHVAMRVLQNAFERKLAYAKTVEERIKRMQPAVEKELAKLGYSIPIPGVRGVSYKLFTAMDSNGQFKDAMTQRFTPEYIESKQKVDHEFFEGINKALKIEDAELRQKAFTVVYTKRNSWYSKNTIILDSNKIPEIINDPKFAGFKNSFKPAEAEAYKKRLISILGEQGYKEEVEKQKGLIADYKANLEAFIDRLIVEEGVEDETQLSQKSVKAVDTWIKRNNPFISSVVFHSMKFKNAIPRKFLAEIKMKDGKATAVDTKQETGYYDKRFETIESNPVLKEFHNLVMEVQEKIFDTMSPEERKNFSPTSLPALARSIIEILFDKDMSLYERISKAAREIYDRLRALFGENVQSSLSHAVINPVTGKPDYKINSAFLKSNKQVIDKRYFIELQRMRQALGLKPSEKIKKYTTYDITKNQEAIRILAENLGVAPTLQAIQNRLKNEDLHKISIGKVLRGAITHQVVSENSFDLPKILKMFSYLTMEYAARKEVLPIVTMLKDHYENIKKPAVNNMGNPIKNVSTRKTRLEGERVRAIKQMESWFNRVVLGDYSSKNEFGDTRIKRALKLNLTNKDKEESFLGKLRTTIDGRIYNADDKIIKSKIPGIKKELVDIINNPESIEETEAARDILKRLDKVDENLGKHFSMTAFFDALFNFIRFKGLGWNLSSYVNNFLEGQISDLLVAASGRYFTPENIYYAMSVARHSFVKNTTWGKVETKEAKLNSILMERYRILQDVTNELQKASAKSAFSSFRSFSPYEGNRRVEYLNQSPLMIAVLLDQKIKGINGEESDVWHAMNPDGTLKDEFRTEENINNWEKANGEQYFNFKSLVTKMLVNVHGDYDEHRGNMASEYILGKAGLMFKRWMVKQFYQRFAINQMDLEAGLAEYKGRYRSHTAASATLQGALVGFGGLGLLGAGPLGLAIGGALGYVTGKFFGVNSEIGFVKELAFATKELFLNMARIPVNVLAGKAVIKHDEYQKFTEAGVSKVDIENYKANMMEMSISLALIGLLLFAKSLLWHDDDDKDDTRRKLHNLLANRFMQLSSQINMYLNPVSAWNNTLGSLPAFRFLTDVQKTATDAEKLLEGDDMILSGRNVGESRFYNQTSKTFLPRLMNGIGTSPNPLTGFGWATAQKENLLGFGVHTKRQFTKSPYDTWFFSTERKAQLAIKEAKLKAKQKYLTKDLSPKEMHRRFKAINSFYRKGKGKTYSEVLKKIKKQDFKP